jgi:hypothetical protein
MNKKKKNYMVLGVLAFALIVVGVISSTAGDLQGNLRGKTGGFTLPTRGTKTAPAVPTYGTPEVTISRYNQFFPDAFQSPTTQNPTNLGNVPFRPTLGDSCLTSTDRHEMGAWKLDVGDQDVRLGSLQYELTAYYTGATIKDVILMVGTGPGGANVGTKTLAATGSTSALNFSPLNFDLDANETYYLRLMGKYHAPSNIRSANSRFANGQAKLNISSNQQIGTFEDGSALSVNIGSLTLSGSNGAYYPIGFQWDKDTSCSAA